MFSWVHKKYSGIPGSGVNGVLDKLNQLMADQWQRSQWVGRSLRWCHPSVTSGMAYPKVVVVNSLPLQDAVWHGENQMGSCPSSVLTSRSFIITSQFMRQERQAHAIESWAQPYLTFIACNATTEVWSVWCTVSPPRTKSAHKISWRGCSLMIRQKYSTDWDVTTM